jgi:outer membrane receptor for ferrienterochelin and colicins
MLMCRSLLLVLLALPFVPLHAAAQSAQAVVTGTVTDSAGLPVSGASVVLRADATGFERVEHAGADGSFALRALSTGSYHLVASLSGFAPATARSDGPSEDPVRLVLRPAPYQEAVTVVSAVRQERLRETASTPVIVVGGEAMRDAGHETVGAALRDVAGIVTRRGSEGTGAAGEQIQGIDSRQVLVLVDGQPVVGARGVKSGVIDLDRESTRRLDRIEIVKGAASALYGSDAIGGVINLISREPRRPAEFAGSVAGGSHGIVDAAADAGGIGRLGTLFISGGRHQQDAFDLTATTLDTTGAAFQRNDLTAHAST